jgi:hypothetical protein
MSIIPIIHIIWVIFMKVKDLGREGFSGIMENYTKENGKKIKRKAVVFGKGPKVFHTWVSGTTI